MIYLHKILPLLISPLFVVLCIILLGAWRKSRKLVFLGALLLYLFSMPYLSDKLFRWAEESAIKQPVESMPEADAIVVLSGMLTPVESTHGIVYEWIDTDRFLAGIDLYRAKKSRRLVFTNSFLPWMNQSVPEGIVLKRYAEQQGIPAANIELTENVQNTAEEAIAVKKLLGETHSAITLVTSAFHMPRARRLFEQQGFSVTPYPVDFKVSQTDITPMSFLPSAYALHQTSIALREMTGRSYYWLRTTIKY